MKLVVIFREKKTAAKHFVLHALKGALKMLDVKMTDVKFTDQMTGHEIAQHCPTGGLRATSGSSGVSIRPAKSP